MNWTKEQQEAIYTRGCDLLVAAAAGSGKTAVLVERIINIITDKDNPVDIDRLLIVTFTNAAAAEMRERIGEALSKKLEEEPRNFHLQKQLALLHRASISTIHAFCLNVIKSNFHLLDIEPSFRIADEGEILLIKTDVLEELFENLYQREDEGFLTLVESYGGKKEDTKLKEMLLDIYNFIESHPWPKDWLRQKVESFNPEQIDFKNSIWIKMIKEQILEESKELLEIAKQAIKLCMEPAGPKKFIDALNDDISHIEKIISLCEGDIEELYNYIQQISLKPLNDRSKDIDENIKTEVKMLRESIREGIQKGFKDKLLFKSPKEMEKDLHKLYPVMKALENVLNEFENRYQAVKKDKGIIDFNDIEHYCLNILLDEKSSMEQIIPSAVAIELQKRYKEILIDEYQDSNLVQETILELISGKYAGMPNRFMVGDVKQSIYRFRLAKPDLFIEKYNSFSTEATGKEQRIDLFKNFRSRKNILDGVNFLFKQLMTPGLGEIEYDEKAALNYAANYPDEEGLNFGGPIELHLIESELTEKEDNIDEELEALTSIELEAKIVARRIKRLVLEDNFYIFDKKLKAYRKVDYKDIVILLRTTETWAHAFTEELTKEGIPAYADVSSGYFDAIEVKTILALLHIIDNPRQDIPLIAVLRSPIVGVSCDDLVEIRTSFSYGDFYESLKRYIEDDFQETELSKRLKNFINNLERWRSLAAHIPIDELLWILYMESNYYNYLGAMPGGEQRQANLRMLRDKAANFEATSYKGLFNFIRVIERMQTGGKGDMGAAKIVGENENIVRIMSIHKSKGLEFPVVIVAGLGKQFNLKDLNNPVLLHQDLGLGPNYVDYEKRLSYETVAKVAIKRKITLETLSEEMRILYVALTRAREKLILTGSVKSIESGAKKWVRQVASEKEELSPYILSKSRTYLDWIGMALARHKDGEKIKSWGNSFGSSVQSLYEDTSSWELIKWSKRDIHIQDESKAVKKEEVLNRLLNWDYSKTYSPEREEIFRRLSWKYPYEAATKISVKLSISEIKSQYEENHRDYPMDSVFEDLQPRQPKFIEEGQVFTGAERGTIIHKVMRHLDFGAKDYKAIEEQLVKMELKGLLTEEERKAVYIPSLLNFCKSGLAERIRKSSLVKRETPFILSLDAREIYKGLNSEEEIFIQGIIDCFFEEEDGIVLVDYKTDFILNKDNPEKEIEKIMDKYRVQINIYTKAIEEITGLKVKEKCLYLFGISRAVFYEE